MKKVSGHEPKMWGPSIIGFASYHYKYASGHEGRPDHRLFSAKKQPFHFYVYTGPTNTNTCWKDWGKYKKSAKSASM